MLCLALSRSRARRHDLAVFAVFAVVLPTLVLIHEAIFFYAAWALALAIALGTVQAAPIAMAAMMLPAIAAFIATALNTGSFDAVLSICASLQGKLGSPRLEDLCGGGSTPVIWLARGPWDSLDIVERFLPQFLVGLPPALLLLSAAFLPLAPAIAALPVPVRRRLLAGSALAVVAGLPLFVVAFDWGRFLFLQFTSFGFVVLTVLARHRDALAAARWAPGLALTLAYALLWSVQYRPTLLGEGYTSLVGGGYVVDYALRLSRGLN